MGKNIGLLRVLCCAALIALLALSGYMGTAKREEAAMVSVPIVFEPLEDVSVLTGGEDTPGRLAREREQALSLLEDVIRDPKASQSAVQAALARKTEIAGYIETEARITQTLEAMGFAGTAALCGGTLTTVIVPDNLLLDGKARVQIVDAAANAAGQSADRIKIIPQKNE